MADSRPSIFDFLRQNIALVLLGLAHLPFLSVYFVGLWQTEHYQFYPFAVAAFLWFYITRSDRGVIRLSWLGRTAIILDMFLLVFIVATGWVELVRLAMLVFCFAVTNGSREWQYPLRLTYLTLLPMVLTRPPTRVDMLALHWLQRNTTWLASRVLEETGHLHLQRGNIIELADKEFLVEEACSGVQSLFTVLFLAALIVCWHRRSLLQACVLFGAGFLFAGAMNVLRISSIVVAWQNWKWDLSHGWQHDALGYIALITAVLMLLSTDSLLHFLFAPFEDHSYGPFSGVYSNPFTAVWNFVCGGRLSPPRPPVAGRLSQRTVVRFCLAFAFVIGGVQILILSAGGAEPFSLPESSLADFDEHALPQEIEGFTLMGYATETRERKNVWGQYSNIWHFQGHGLKVHVSCDHLFKHWHPLHLCYAGAGWHVSPTEQLKGLSEWDSVTSLMERPSSGRHGCVIYSHFTVSGKHLVPEATEFSLAYYLQRPHMRLAGGIWSLVSEPMVDAAYQVQVFTEAGRPQSEEQFAALRRLHETTHRLLRKHWIESRSNPVVSNVD